MKKQASHYFHAISRLQRGSQSKWLLSRNRIETRRLKATASVVRKKRIISPWNVVSSSNLLTPTWCKMDSTPF